MSFARETNRNRSLERNEDIGSRVTFSWETKAAITLMALEATLAEFGVSGTSEWSEPQNAIRASFKCPLRPVRTRETSPIPTLSECWPLGSALAKPWAPSFYARSPRSLCHLDTRPLGQAFPRHRPSLPRDRRGHVRRRAADHRAQDTVLEEGWTLRRA